MKPLSGLSLQDMGQSIANLGPVYSSVPSASWPANTIPMQAAKSLGGGSSGGGGGMPGVGSAGGGVASGPSGGSVVSAMALQSMGRVIRNSPLMVPSAPISNTNLNVMAPSAVSNGGSNIPASVKSSPGLPMGSSSSVMMMPLATMPGAASAGTSNVAGTGRNGGNAGASGSSSNLNSAGASITNISIPNFSHAAPVNPSWNAQGISTSTNTSSSMTTSTATTNSSIANLKASERSNMSSFTPPQAAAAMMALSMLGDVAANLDNSSSGNSIGSVSSSSTTNSSSSNSSSQVGGHFVAVGSSFGPSPLSIATSNNSTSATTNAAATTTSNHRESPVAQSSNTADADSRYLS